MAEEKSRYIDMNTILYETDAGNLWATQDLMSLASSLPTSHLLPCNSGLKLMQNRLKRLKIKQGTTSKVNCILFNRLLSLNKSSLVQAKAGNFNLKSLNRCFSNYYQVQTWPVFAETVTFINSTALYNS